MSSDRAFERLYERNEREVYRYVLGVLRNPAEAEDVTQTTFLNAYRAIRAGAEPQKPQNWLIAIAHNACRSRVRLLMRRPREVPLDEVSELERPEPERLNVRDLVRAIRRLPENQRAALTLREFEGRSYPEIAEALGVTVPAVEALLSRARRTLKRQANALRGAIALQFPAAAAKVAAVVVAGAVAGAAGDTAGVSKPLPRPRAPAIAPVAARARPPAPARRAVRHRAPAAVPVRVHARAARRAPAPAQPAQAPAAAPPAPPAATPPAAVPQLPEPPALPALPSLPPLPPLPPIPPVPLPQVFPGSGI